MRQKIELLEQELKESNYTNVKKIYMDDYVTSGPSIQNVVDIFKGKWISTLPFDGVISGERPHFTHDERVL